MFRRYFFLTKPGIILGNAVTAAGGFALASRGNIDFGLFLATLVGLSLVVASACVFNNYTDRHSDAKMERTKNRVLVKGVIPERSALLFAVLLGLFSFLVLALYTNFLTVTVAFSGFFIYVVLYGIWKHRSTLGTVIGSFSGGVPPVVGYCAVSDHFDLGAFLLFLVMVFWQMPHFLAIAMYRLDDYAAASIPVLPVQKGGYVTKVYMLFYIVAFVVATCMLTVLGYTGCLYLGFSVVLGMVWLWQCLRGFWSKDEKLWARRMFLFSLLVVAEGAVTEGAVTEGAVRALCITLVSHK